MGCAVRDVEVVSDLLLSRDAHVLATFQPDTAERRERRSYCTFGADAARGLRPEWAEWSAGGTRLWGG